MLAKECDDNISTNLQKGPYSIAKDASTDMESIKWFSLVMKYFHSKHHFNQSSQGLGVYVRLFILFAYFCKVSRGVGPLKKFLEASLQCTQLKGTSSIQYFHLSCFRIIS